MVGVRVVDHCTTYFRNVAVYSLDDDTQESEPEPGSSFSVGGSVVSFSEDNALLIDGNPFSHWTLSDASRSGDGQLWV